MPAPADLDTSGLLCAVGERTLALAAAAAGLDDAALRAPSALPGWTRGHVLAHVCLNAEAFTGVLTSAAAGVQVPMYPSRQARDADIEATAGQPPAVLLRRLLTSADAFATAWRALPAERLDAPVGSPAGWSRPAADVVWLRWREVVLHHVDLAVGFVLASAGDQVSRLLAETAGTFGGRDDVAALTLVAQDSGRQWQLHGPDGPTVRGSEAALAGWLTGRADGSDLACDGPLPRLPAWA